MAQHIGVPIWAIFWSLFAFGLASWTALVPLEGVPHVQDEVVYAFQARALIDGGFGAEPPGPLGSSSYHFILERAGQRFGVFPTGWPAVLAIGIVLGLGSFVNPALLGGMVFLGAELARRLRGDRAALIAAPLFALSPQLVLQGASMMSHTLCALLTLGALRLMLDPPRPARVVCVGLMLGLIALTRYLDALVVGLLVVWWAGSAPGRRAHLLFLMLPILGAAALIGLQNQRVTGDIWTFPVTAYFDAGVPPTNDKWWRYAPGCNSLGFGADRGCFPTYGDVGHTPHKALRNLWTNLQVAGRLLVGFAPVLLFGLAAVFSADRAISRFSRQAWILWAGLAGAYSLYWVPGLCYGARFHHAALPGVLLTVVIGVDLLLERWPGARLLPLMLGALFSWRLIGALPELEGYWGVDGRFQRLHERSTEGKAVVLVAYREEALRTLSTPETTMGGLTVRPSLRRGAWVGAVGPLVILEYHPELVEETLRAHPGTPAFLYVMSQDPADDELMPLPASWRATPQSSALTLPVDPVLLRASPSATPR